MFGLFDWIWELLYGVSKSMYSIIDNLLACGNMLCGIEPIRYAGTEMDFLTFLLRNQNIVYAFTGAVLISIVLVAVFGVIAIIRTIASEKNQKTPAQVVVSVAKTILTFIFIPVAMAVLIFFTNTIMKVLYMTTTGGSQDGLGRFLAGAFGQDALKDGVPSDFYLSSSFNYHSTGNVKNFLDLSDYDYFFSWISSIVIIICIGAALLVFVDRAIAIVILFIFAPISMSTTVLDDGARFKLWRDQFISKFLMGYGCIIAINIYALIIAAITNDNLVFFDNTTLNNVMKIVIIVGGGVSMMRMQALVANLISAGSGTNEMRETAIAGGAFRRAMVGGAMLPFRATRSALGFIKKGSGKDSGSGGQGGSPLSKLAKSGDIEKARFGNDNRGGSGAANNKTGRIAAGNNNAKNAIGDVSKKVLDGNAQMKNGGSNAMPANAGGNSNNKQQANPIVSNAINNSLNNKNGGNKK